MEQEIIETMQFVRQILGTWRGNGCATFPTFPKFDYREELEFTANDVQPYVRFEQRTLKKLESGEYVPSHWEVGFWHIVSANEIEISNAQGGGRVEVLRGRIEPASTGFTLNLSSTHLGNDERMRATTRRYILRGTTIEYMMQMSTTAVPEMTLHLEAILLKES